MSVINFGQSVTLQEFAKSIGTVGKEVTIIGQGEPGIGKSSMLKVLSTTYPNYEIAYIDCTLLDLGDFALPYTETAGDMRVIVCVLQQFASLMLMSGLSGRLLTTSHLR